MRHKHEKVLRIIRPPEGPVMTDAPQGKLSATLNPFKQPGDKRPAFTGTLTLPGQTDERPVSLWAQTSKAGNAIMTGRAGESAATQIAKLTMPAGPFDDDAIQHAKTDGKHFVIDSHDIMLFEARKTETSHARAPDYWGYFNPGPGHELMRLAVWAKTDMQGRAKLSGTVKAYVADVEPVISVEPTQAPAKARRRSRAR
jgi:hypothetical protein